MRMFFDCGSWTYSTKEDSHREEDLVNEFLDLHLSNPERYPISGPVRMEIIPTEEDARIHSLIGDTE